MSFFLRDETRPIPQNIRCHDFTHAKIKIDPDVDFFVFDFETANSDRDSICQIGIASVRNGQIHQNFYIYVDPGVAFDAAYSRIHGIKSKTVQGAPDFRTAMNRLSDLFETAIALSHTSFDRVAMERAYATTDRAMPLRRYIDSSTMARRTWDKYAQAGYGLEDLCRDFGIEFEHHNAGEDARATAEIVLLALKESGADIVAWIDLSQKPKTYAGRSYVGKAISMEGNPDGALAGAIAVFTGELTMTRKDAAKFSAQVGITVAAAVTKKTTLLIVGEQDLAVLAGHEKSSKHRKAEELIAQGQDLRIIGEAEFMRLVAENMAAAGAPDAGDDT